MREVGICGDHLQNIHFMQQNIAIYFLSNFDAIFLVCGVEADITVHTFSHACCQLYLTSS